MNDKQQHAGDLNSIYDRLVGMQVLISGLSSEIKHTNKALEESGRRMDSFLNTLAAQQASISTLQVQVARLETVHDRGDLYDNKSTARMAVAIAAIASIMAATFSALATLIASAVFK